ncbi:MAG: methyltransferase domain-containing protein [Clostridiales bacterium]|nr:methyltransferase domain-containing protein [Clostridiales bacterium]
MDNTEAIRGFYDTQVENEWKRIDGRPEFIVTCRFLDRYIRPGNRVLDIGGGPGRYALYLAEKGCEVTLLDLSPANVRFAADKATEQGLKLCAVEGDARTADETMQGTFDHVLLMGPLYHLQTEEDRIRAVNASLRLLKPGGLFYASFINLYSGLIYAMKHEPECVLDQDKETLAYLRAILNDDSFTGHLFTHAFFVKPSEILPFMARFPLDKLHFFAQEGVTAPCELTIMAQPKAVVDAWLDLSETLSEREELHPMAEHLMYIGRKR